MFYLWCTSEFLFLAGLGFGLGGSQGGEAASLGDLLLTFLFGLLYNRAEHSGVSFYWGRKAIPQQLFHHAHLKTMYNSTWRSSPRSSEKDGALIISYLQPLGQQFGVLRSFILVLLCALSLKGDAAAFVLQHTGRHQALDLRGLGPGLLTWRTVRQSLTHSEQREKLKLPFKKGLVSCFCLKVDVYITLVKQPDYS